MKYYAIGEFAEKIGKSIQTIRNCKRANRAKKMIKELLGDDIE